ALRKARARRATGVQRLSPRVLRPVSRASRGSDPCGRVGVFLRGRRPDDRRGGRNGQEPRQQGARTALRTPWPPPGRGSDLGRRRRHARRTRSVRDPGRMTEPPTRRNPADGLGFRVAFLLAIVLLPLTVISVVKSMAVIEESRGRSEAALMGETLRAASGELRYIQEARGAAKVLSKSIWPLMPDNAACTGFLQRMLEVESHYSLVAFVPRSGISTCNSAGRIFSFKDDPLFLRAAHDRGTSFAVKAVGLVSGTSVLVITHPVFDEAAGYRGFVSLSIPHSGIRVAEDSEADVK